MAGPVAPVMGNEDHIALQIDIFENQTAFRPLRDIRRKQKSPFAKGEFEYERAVIRLIVKD